MSVPQPILTTVSSQYQELPIAPDQLQVLVGDVAASKPHTRSAWIDKLLPQLQAKLSKHKFFVSVTTVGGGDVEAATTVGGVWDPSRDGFVTYRHEGDDVTLITVHWIYVE